MCFSPILLCAGVTPVFSCAGKAEWLRILFDSVSGGMATAISCEEEGAAVYGVLHILKKSEQKMLDMKEGMGARFLWKFRIGFVIDVLCSTQYYEPVLRRILLISDEGRQKFGSDHVVAQVYLKAPLVVAMEGPPRYRFAIW